MTIDGVSLIRRRTVLAPLLAALPGITAAAIASTKTLDTGEISATLQSIVDSKKYPLASLSVQWIQGGKVAYEAQFGYRAMRSGGRPALPVTADTLFRMASVSKLVVALGAMRLVDAGRLDLDGDIGSVLGYRVRHPGYPDTPISCRMLLSHQSSLSDSGGYSFGADTSLQSLLQAKAGKGSADPHWADAKPGSFFQYCNFNFGVLASVMELAAGKRFDQLMHDEVLQPLGMAGGFYPASFSPQVQAQVATIYRKVDRKAQWDANGTWLAQTDDFRNKPAAPIAGLQSYRLGFNGTLFSPQGGLRTRVKDLGTVMLMLLNGGQFSGQSFLASKTISALMTELWRYDPSTRNGDSLHGMFQAWGLGLQHFIDRSGGLQSGHGEGDRLRQSGGVQAWGHLGDAYGLQSGLILDPVGRNGVVYALGGVSADTETTVGAYSSFTPWEESLLNTLWSAVK